VTVGSIYCRVVSIHYSLSRKPYFYLAIYSYIINRIYTLGTCDEHRLEQVVRLATMKFN